MFSNPYHSLFKQATQQDDTSKTANTVLYVTIVDVDDNPPKFEQDQYTATISENSPLDQVVFQTRVTDLDMVLSSPVNRHTRNIFQKIFK